MSVQLEDGSTEYTTVQGDMLDHICWLHYGREWGVTEQVLDTNYGLAAKGTVYGAGEKIILPAVQLQEPKKASVKLWD